MSTPAASSSAAPKWVWQAVGRPPVPAKAMDPRAKAALQFVVMGAVGAFIRWKFPAHRAGAYVVWSLASVFLVCALAVPPAYKAIDRFFFALLPKWVASALNWMLLVPFFYLVFFPVRLAMGLTGNDPMTRRMPTDLPTYWCPRKPVADVGQYKKQH